MKRVRQSDRFEMLALLQKEYDGAICALTHGSAYQLLVATMLSAQCTDATVNKVSPKLFQVAGDPHQMLLLKPAKLEELIHSTGFYSAKAKNILATSRMLVDEFGGEVPDTLDELIQLPGVGRKTASVVLGTAFGKEEGIVVDTHVKRLSQRMGWAKSESAEQIEVELMKWIPKEQWIAVSHWLIHHGRAICAARKPLCCNCSLQKLCPSSQTSV